MCLDISALNSAKQIERQAGKCFASLKGFMYFSLCTLNAITLILPRSHVMSNYNTIYCSANSKPSRKLYIPTWDICSNNIPLHSVYPQKQHSAISYAIIFLLLSI